MICRRYGQMPSDRLQMEAQGFPATTAYQFDKAVAMLANRIEQQSQVTVPTRVKTLPDAGKGYTWGQAPKYTMRQLLTDQTDQDTDDDWHDDVPTPDTLKHLPTAGL